MKLNESSLPQMYSKGLFEEKSSDLAPEHTDKMFDCIFTGTANLLNKAKSLTTPTAFVFESLGSEFVAGAIVQYFPSENKKSPGNWSLVWTFDAKDLPKDALIIKLNEAAAHTYFIQVAGQKYGMMFESTAQMETCLTYALQQLKKWLDENAKEGTTVSIEQDGIFQARVAIENGEKVFAIEADGEVKNLIKDDAAIEK